MCFLLRQIFQTAITEGTEIPADFAFRTVFVIRTQGGVGVPIPFKVELELELMQTQMAQKPMLRAEVGMCVRCANKANAE